MPLQLMMALLSNPQARGFLGRSLRGLGGLFRGGAAREPAFPTPAQFGGRGFTGTAPTFGGRVGATYGQAGGGGLTPSFTIPGAGGGSVMIPALAEAASRGDVFAGGAIGRQGERFGRIDALIELMREQAREAGMPDPFEGSAPVSVGGGGFY